MPSMPTALLKQSLTTIDVNAAVVPTALADGVDEAILGAGIMPHKLEP